MIATFRPAARRLRRSTVLIALASTMPLFSGCVSAVDNSSAFGFNTTGSSTNGPATSSDSAPVDVEKAPAAPGDQVASIAVSGEGGKGEAAVAAAPGPKAEALAAQKTSDASAAVPVRATIAAYAGATVTVGDTSQEEPVSQAGNTRFASLFAESQAKTPIRNADVGKSRRVLVRQEGAPIDVAALPGVKPVSSLFEIGQKASADYDADILDEANGEEGSYQVASLSGLARLAPSGLLVQREDVETGCFEPKLVALLKAVETRFNTKVVVTSGYRSPTHNRLVNGARRSLHMACKAADILVPGADKFLVANYVRDLPGRGGVGTYCHTTAIHIDIGDQRDWNWACRRRRT